jgi:hypothetical protein
MSSSAIRSNLDASSAPGHSGITRSSTCTGPLLLRHRHLRTGATPPTAWFGPTAASGWTWVWLDGDDPGGVKELGRSAHVWAYATRSGLTVELEQPGDTTKRLEWSESSGPANPASWRAPSWTCSGRRVRWPGRRPHGCEFGCSEAAGVDGSHFVVTARRPDCRPHVLVDAARHVLDAPARAPQRDGQLSALASAGMPAVEAASV